MAQLIDCLRCSAVAMGYGKQKVLLSCSLRVGCGEVIGLIGENGTGKSTLLKGILGFLPLDSGTVHITAPVGFCPQENILNNSLTVLEHFQFFDSLQRYPVTSDSAYQEKLILETGLFKFLRTPIGNLSGGTYQKVKLVTAIWNKPRMLILDEPCDGFDWQMYLLFWKLVESLTLAGTGILMVSHLLHDQERFHRIYQLKEGVLENTK